MRRAPLPRFCAAILAVVTGLAAPGGALAHGLAHDRLAHGAEHGSAHRHGPAEAAVLEPAESDHPHPTFTTTGCSTLVLRLPAAIPSRDWLDAGAVVSSQRIVPTDQTSCVDPPPHSIAHSRAPPNR